MIDVKLDGDEVRFMLKLLKIKIDNMESNGLPCGPYLYDEEVMYEYHMATDLHNYLTVKIDSLQTQRLHGEGAA